VSALYAWFRRHPQLVDSALAIPVALISIADALRTHQTLLILVGIALALPIVVRRKYPVGAFTTVIVAGAVQVLTRTGLEPSDVAVLILLYTIAAYTNRRISLSGLAICLYGSAIEVIRLSEPLAGASTLRLLAAPGVVFAGPCLIAWVLGDSTRYRRAYYLNLEERAARLERDRESNAILAAAAERARIARELHDVVAHNVSVMVVQADGAAYALDSDPARTRAALAAISATGRQALTEMRVLLGVLRRGDDSGAALGDARADLAPQPGLGQLDELLDQTRSTGLPVICRVEGEPRTLAAGTALTVYRIVQESLTNTRKHGGPLARANVLLRYTADAVQVNVTDSGLGPAAPCDGAGHGLTGMSERVAMYGGSVQAGPRAGGGFEVIATLPISPVSASAA
jgi:signal transduction histidine kinase